MGSDRDIFRKPKHFGCLVPELCLNPFNACVTSVSNSLEIKVEPSEVRLDTAFRESPLSVSKTFDFEEIASQFHRKATHFTVQAVTSLLTAAIVSSNDSSKISPTIIPTRLNGPHSHYPQ